MRIPSSIIAGDTIRWTDYAFADGQGASVGATDYALTYSFRGPGAVLDLVGGPQGTAWVFTMSAAQSAALNTGAAPAVWYWQAFATQTGVRITAGTGSLTVRPNLAASSSTSFDLSSPAQKILKAIEAEIAARVSGGATVEYTIGTRSLKKEPMAELLKLRAAYRITVSRELTAQALANGLGNPKRLGVRFK